MHRKGGGPFVVLLRGRQNHVEILLDPILFGEVPPALRYVLDRVLTTTLALECTLSYRDATEFEHAVCLSDFGHAGCRRSPATTSLISSCLTPVRPDAAYVFFRSAVDRDWIPWHRREHRVIWRGQLNGSPASADEASCRYRELHCVLSPAASTMLTWST